MESRIQRAKEKMARIINPLKKSKFGKGVVLKRCVCMAGAKTRMHRPFLYC